jgi:predicted nicotinamide N-methyase
VTQPDELEAVEESLRRRFRVATSDIRVGSRTLSILHPESAEELIDEQAFERDERLPYWADVWPSARVLAEHVLSLRGDGRSLLELGCGCGLVATCASIAGFDVVASDYYEDALRFARVNAQRNGAPPLRVLPLDWRHLRSDLGRFEVVLASDVLYERTYGPLMAKVLGQTLAKSGVAIVADPGRVAREEFLGCLETNGLALIQRRECPFVDGDIRQTITLLEIAHSAESKTLQD